VSVVTYETEECGELEQISKSGKDVRFSSTHGLLLCQVAGSSQNNNDGVVLQLEVSGGAWSLAFDLRGFRDSDRPRRGTVGDEMPLRLVPKGTRCARFRDEAAARSLFDAEWKAMHIPGVCLTLRLDNRIGHCVGCPE
jgi:hypothetical protein